MNKRVIVTGGAGFLGRHLCRSLVKEGYEVKVIDLHPNPEFPTTIANIQDTEAMKREITQADAVFHLAASIEAGGSVQEPQAYIDNNISGSLSLLEAMKANDVKTIIFSSTAAVYGEPPQVPITEDMATMPINPYGVTKLAMEGLVSCYVANFGFTGVAMRYFNLYGPEEHHQPETHAIPRFIKQIFTDQEVTVYGEGQHLRDYVYIADIVEAHMLALELAAKTPQKYHMCNLSTQKPASVLEVIENIASIMNKIPHITHLPDRPGDPLKLYASSARAKELLGWEARTSLRQGLTQVVHYFQEYWRTHPEVLAS